MNKQAAAIVGAIIGVVIVGSVAVSGSTASSSENLGPTAAEVVVATPDPTNQPTAKATPVATAEPTMSPAASATAAPAAPTASPEPIATTVRVPKLTAKVKGATRIKYFGVKGDSPDALLDSTVRKSKAACELGDALACVSLRPNIRWTNRTRVATGACTIVAPKVDLKSTVYLPRWKSGKPVQPALVAWWGKMVDHMAWHEGQHIKIQKKFDAKLPKLMAGRACSSANKIIKKWNKSVRVAQDKFNAKDLLWPYPEYTGPGGWDGTN